MHLLRPIGLLAACVMISLVSPARADLLYSAPPDYTQTSYESTSLPTGEQEVSPFQLAALSSITSITWWGDYFSNSTPSDGYTLRLYTGAAGPDPTAFFSTDAISVIRTDLGFTGLRGYEEYRYDATLSSPISLTGGTPYYLAVLNSNPSWDWQLDGSGTNYFRFGGEGTPWGQSGNPHQDAFELNGTAAAVVTPEPSTWVMAAGCGLVGLVHARRRWRKLEG